MMETEMQSLLRDRPLAAAFGRRDAEGPSGWQRDVALELWVEVDRERATITVAGDLDDRTGDSLLSVIRQLTGEGVAVISLVTRRARLVGRPGVGVLLAAAQLAGRVGCLVEVDRPLGV